LKKKNGPPPGVSQVTQVVQASKNNIQNESTIPQESSINQAQASSSSDNTSNTNTDIVATKSHDDQVIRPKTPENITEAFKQPASGSTAPVPGSSSVATPSSTKSTPSKPKKRKCQMCKKKIGLTGFECRCGKLYCSTHRYADVHNCTFDYKEDGREKIRKANPTCTDDKITRF